MLNRSRLVAFSAGIALATAVALSGCASARTPSGALVSPTASSDLTTATSAPSSTSTPDSGLDTALTNFLATAKQNLLSGSMTISYVVSTSDVAQRQLLGSSSGSTQHDTSGEPVVAMVAEGDFSGQDEKVPLGVTPSPGRYLARIARLSDGAVIGWSLVNDDPGLSELGKPTILSQ